MNKTAKKILTLLLVPVSLIGAVSCDDDLAQPPVPTPEGGIESIGNGRWDRPMSVYQARLGSVANDTVTDDEGNSFVKERATSWVTGYIVGWIDVDISNVMKEETFKRNVPATVATNIVMAPTPDETDWEKCISVQLPSGPVRSALNLKDHPENLGVQVTVLGTTGEKYCSVYGVRSVSDYAFGDKGNEPQPPVEVEAVASLYCDFDQSDRIDHYTGLGWKNISEKGGLSGWYIREFNGNNYVTCSAYLGSENGGPYSNWLIAPPVDLTKSPKKTLTFRTQAAYAAEGSKLEVYVMNTDDPAKAQLTKVEAKIATPGASGYSSWVESGEIDLSQFTGVVYIGFNYTSEKGGQGFTATYCVDNVNIGGADATQVPDDKPSTGSLTFRKASQVVSGKRYVMVASGKLAKAVSGSYGYLNVEDAVTEGDEVTLTSLANAFTFTTSGEGFTIRQENGKYLAMKGTFNSFNVYDTPQEMNVFTVTFNADGSAKITNAGTGKTIQYDKSYSSFGAYTDQRGVMPTLYEQVD